MIQEFFTHSQTKTNESLTRKLAKEVASRELTFNVWFTANAPGG